MLQPLNPGYFQASELRALGFSHVGEGTAVATNCTIIGVENIVLGDRVRIDGYTTIIASGGRICIGSNVHICSGCVLGGRGGIEIGDYASLSHGVRLLSAVDDFSGERMTNSTLPETATRIQVAQIYIGKHCPIGSGALILPGARIEEGAAVAAMSLVAGQLPAWTICAGNPAQPLRSRSRRLLDVAENISIEGSATD